MTDIQLGRSASAWFDHKSHVITKSAYAVKRILKSAWTAASDSFRRRSLAGEILALQLAFTAIIGLFAFASVRWISDWMIEDNTRQWSEQWIARLDELGMPLYVSDDAEKYLRVENYANQYPEISSIRYYSAAGAPALTDLPHQDNVNVPRLSPEVLARLASATSDSRTHLIERLDQEQPLLRISKPIWTESLSSDGLLDFDLSDESAVTRTLVGFVELTLDYTSYQTSLSRYFLLGGIGCLIALLLLTSASWYVYRRALRPLSQLQNSLEELAKGEIDINVEASGHKEIKAVADALNTTIAALNERDKRLWNMANHDPLTGLINRHRFEELFKEELEEIAKNRTTSALLFLDLDQFKYVNDTVGHAAGDRLLKDVASRLENIVGDSGVVSRFGGDEFLILISDIDRDDVESICQKFVQNLREHIFFENDESFAVSCSVGATIVDETGSSHTDLLAQADLACFQAKALGRNRVQLYEASETGIRRMAIELSWSQKIKAALRDELFVLHYQPIVDVHTGEAVLYEGLIRMRSEHGDLIPPAAFLPAASRFGLMTEIDEWVIRTAIRDLGEYRARYGDIRFALNVSGSFFASQKFVHSILNTLDHEGVPLEAVVLEITEQVAVASSGGTDQRMAQLVQQGLKFAIDDFGAGYSSYNYLKTLPVNYIKIDGSFIKELAGDEVDRAIVDSICQIARATGKKTVAEHVQDYDTMEILRSLGVDYAQSYLLGVPAETLQREPAQVSAASEAKQKSRTA